MRGLDTRVLLPQTRITFSVDAEALNGQMMGFYKQAEEDRRRDAANGIDSAPADTCLSIPATFHQDAWSDKCAQLVNDAYESIGGYDQFVAVFSSLVDEALQEIAQAECTLAVDIARQFGYETVEEREETFDRNAALEEAHYLERCNSDVDEEFAKWAALEQAKYFERCNYYDDD
jgi:hypothetical protein